MTSPLSNSLSQQHSIDELTSNILSTSSNSSSSFSTSLENNGQSPLTNNNNSTGSFSSLSQAPQPTRSHSATTLRSPPTGGGSQMKRHHVRSPQKQPTSSSIDRSISQPPQRPTSPITSPSIHKSLTALDAKLITRDMEKSVLQLRGEDVMSPTSPTQQQQQGFYYNMNNSSSTTTNNMNNSNAKVTPQYHRQNSVGSVIVPPTATFPTSAQGDAWQTLCVKVLPLFNGEGVQGSIEDLNDLLR